MMFTLEVKTLKHINSIFQKIERIAVVSISLSILFQK